MGKSQNGPRLVDRIYDEIFASLADRGLTRNEALSDKRLAEELKVSRTPVRVALARLETEGIIYSIPSRGWRLTPLTVEAIEDIFDLKELLEPYAARRATANLTSQTAPLLRRIMESMEAASAGKNWEAWLAAHTSFHYLLLDLAGSPRLRQIIVMLEKQWYPLWVRYIVPSTQQETAQFWEEHRAVAEAMLARDADLAGTIYCANIRRQRTKVLDTVRSALQSLGR